jgi:hypothetical protein
LDVDQIEELITDDLKYRNQQLKRLKEEVLDLEDMNESVSLTDFTLDDFRIELSSYLEANRKRLMEAPLGLYSVVPAPAGQHAALNGHKQFTETEKDILKPGVIFCLKQKKDSDGNEEVNPLNPYFLVYVRDDGNVRFNYTNAKQILEIFRLMCQGIKIPYAKLCEIFNDETNNCEKMDAYTDLLKKATAEIMRVFQKRGNQRLTSDRGALVIPLESQLKELENFELITWLIVR